MIIRNAKDVKLTSNPGTLPDMGDALTSWFQKMSFVVITKNVVNYDLAESQVTNVNCMGVKQPMSAQRLAMKSDGERTWKWWTIHAYPDLVLKDDDIITFGNDSYRVMGKIDYSEYGYVCYDICQDYTP